VHNCGLRKSVDCAPQEAGFLHYKFLCRDHFLPIAFTTPEGIHLYRLAVPCGLDSASHSIPQSSLPLLLPQLHVWLEIKWHYFQLASVLFRFELSASDLISCIHVNIWFLLCNCAILSDSCVYIASIFQNDLCHETLITVCFSTDLLWVEAPCTVLFADKCAVSLVERTSNLCAWH